VLGQVPDQAQPASCPPPVATQRGSTAHRSSAIHGSPSELGHPRPPNGAQPTRLPVSLWQPLGLGQQWSPSGQRDWDPFTTHLYMQHAGARQQTHSWNRRASQPKPRALLLRTHEQLWDQPNTITTSLPLGTPQFTTWHTHAEYLMIILADPTPPMYSLQSPSVPFPCFDVTPTVTSSHSRCHGTQVTSPLILTCYTTSDTIPPTTSGARISADLDGLCARSYLHHAPTRPHTRPHTHRTPLNPTTFHSHLPLDHTPAPHRHLYFGC